MADLTPTVVVEVELSGVGGGWTNIAVDVCAAPGLVIRRGIRGSGPQDLVAQVGTATFCLRNDTRTGKPLGYYSLYHASKRTGWALGINARVRLTDPATATTHTMFVGKVDRIKALPGTKMERRVEVTVVDWMYEALRWTLTPEIGEQINKRGDEILTTILAEMPIQPTATSLDITSETYPVALDQADNAETKAMTAFSWLAASEQGPIYVAKDGTFRFERRHTRLLKSTVWTLTSTDLYAAGEELDMPSAREEITNTVRVKTHAKVPDPLPYTEVYTQTNAIRINAGETQFLLGSFQDQVTGERIGATEVQTQVAGSDYVFNSDPDGAGTDLTANLTVTVSVGPSGARFEFENTGGVDGYLSRNVLIGRAIRDRGEETSEASDSASVTAYGENVVVIDMPFQASKAVGQAAADFKLDQFGTPSDQVRSVPVFGKASTLLTQILTRDISDQIAVQETVTGLNAEFWINGIDLTVLPSGHVSVVYTTTPAIDPNGGTYWILGTSTLGTSTIPAAF